MRSGGSLNCSIGLAALRAMAMNSALRQRCMPGRIGGGDHHPRDDVGGVLEVEVAFQQPFLARLGQRRRAVEAVAIAGPDLDVGDLEQPAADALDPEALGGGRRGAR